mmetsp:Transcript_4941/g.19767  ORF Transcript_4941/g.19767 Transcript_4941/m.19767 type:complete len:140 (-) Transcript_4941:237-656(-)
MWQRHLLRFLFLLLGLGTCVASKFGIPRRDMWILFGIGGCAAFAVGVAAIQAYHFSTGRGKPLDEHFATVVENPFLGNTAAHRDPRFRTARSDRAAVEQKARLQEFYSLFPEDIRQYVHSGVLHCGSWSLNDTTDNALR